MQDWNIKNGDMKMTEHKINSFHGVTKIEALRYRSLRYISQPLKQFQILVGPNASGKSTFLDTIAILGDLIRTDLDTAVRGDARLEIPMRAPDPRHLVWLRHSDHFELAVELAIPSFLATEKNKRFNRIRYEMGFNVGENPSIEIENLWLLSSEAKAIQGRQLSLFPKPEPPPAHIARQPNKRTPEGWKKIISRGGGGKAYFRSETSGWNAPFALPSQKAALATLPEDRERFPLALWLRDVLQSGVQRITLSGEAMRRPAPLTRKHGYLPDGSNLPYVVERLERQNKEQYERWLDHVRESLPDIKKISTLERQEDRHRYLVLHYKNGLEAPSWLVSDGTLRMLALTLLAYTSDIHGGIYLIEEPENGIHPRAVETVYQALSSVYGAQVLLATHSPVILGMSELDNLLCFARDQNGATDVISGNEHPKIRDWKGTLNLSSLFAAGVLG